MERMANTQNTNDDTRGLGFYMVRAACVVIALAPVASLIGRTVVVALMQL